MKRAIQVAALAAFAAASIAGCGGGNGGAEVAAGDTATDVPGEVALSWPAMYGYLLASLGTAPDQQEPAGLPGEQGPVSDVVEPEVKP